MSEMVPGDQGRCRVIEVPNPAAATNWALTQDVRTRWRVICIKFRYTADANVSARVMNIRLGYAAGYFLLVTGQAQVTASQVRDIQFYIGANQTTPSGGTYIGGNLPVNLLLNNQTQISSICTGMQAADQISSIFIVVEEWIEPLA